MVIHASVPVVLGRLNAAWLTARREREKGVVAEVQKNNRLNQKKFLFEYSLSK